MHPVDKAEKILSGQWPKNPKWTYESPDNGKTVYRRLFGSPGAERQLYMINSKQIDTEKTLDEQYFTQVYKW